jgi:hypothetical protein
MMSTAPISRSCQTIRHPSESWGIPVGERYACPMIIPAFAGMTVEFGVAGVAPVLAAEGPIQ